MKKKYIYIYIYIYIRFFHEMDLLLFIFLLSEDQQQRDAFYKLDSDTKHCEMPDCQNGTGFCSFGTGMFICISMHFKTKVRILHDKLIVFL